MTAILARDKPENSLDAQRSSFQRLRPAGENVHGSLAGARAEVRCKRKLGVASRLSWQIIATCIRCAYDVTRLSFEWDEQKRRSNLRKHRIDFADAISVLVDDDALTMPDDESDEEDRFVTLGADLFGRLLVVIYTWRGDTLRIISARKATSMERERYGAR